MTVGNLKSAEKNFKIIVAIFLTVTSVLLLVFRADDIAESARGGMKLAASSVIPVLFPFLVLSDYISLSGFDADGVIARMFSKITGLNPRCFSAFICGNICGFPTGARCAVNLYRDGVISREECERAIGVSNNPSLAFVVSGVGAGMCGDVKIGVVLYLTLLGSSLVTANIFRGESGKSANSNEIAWQKFNFVESIKNAGMASLAISSYIVFFSVILGVLESLLENESLIAVISALLEVGNATSKITELGFDLTQRIPFLCLALGFSGFCVHFQTFEIMPRELSKRKYLLIKLTEGLVALIISGIITVFRTFVF